MKKKSVIFIAGIAALLLIVMGFVISRINSDPEVSKDEIGFKIQLDLGEDIGLFIIYSDANGETESGGVSNADKSLIKKDDVLFWYLEKEYHKDLPDTVDMKLQFNIVTEYFDPNYENIYPEEYVIHLDKLSLKAAFGELYKIRVTGDKTSGYKAILDKQ